MWIKFSSYVFKSIINLSSTYLSTLFIKNSTREPINLRTSETEVLVPQMRTSNY